jgi:hypothetical protein
MAKIGVLYVFAALRISRGEASGAGQVVSFAGELGCCDCELILGRDTGA